MAAVCKSCGQGYAEKPAIGRCGRCARSGDANWSVEQKPLVPAVIAPAAAPESVPAAAAAEAPAAEEVTDATDSSAVNQP